MFPAPCSSLRLRAVMPLLFGMVSTLALPAGANDGGLAMGGSPRLLSGHPSVTMTSEVINLTVEKEKVTVDCQFVFTNHGPACTVRMGFPDEGIGAEDPDEDLDEKDLSKTPPRTTFLSFRSSVDGIPVATRLIRAREISHFWHTKMVSFPAHSVRRVHDVYTQGVGGGVTYMGETTGRASQIAYILHTGSSWHGNIGRSEINVTFVTKELPGAPRLLSLKQVSKNNDGRDLNIASVAANAIVWQGPCAPRVKGKNLQFIRTNWHPTVKDDIQLTYGYKSLASK